MPVEGAEVDAPAESNGRSAAFAIGLGVAMALGLAIRVAFVLIRQRHVVLTTGDAYWYHYQAKLVADGKGFLNPFSYYKDHLRRPGADHPPGFVLILAAADVLGISTQQGQRLLMCLMGTASVGVIGLVGRRIANVRVGLLAALVAAAYPNMWINDGMLMAETPFVFGVALSLLFTYRIIDRPRRLDVLGLSACLTLAAMTRPESIVLFPLLLVPVVMWRRTIPVSERAFQVGMAALVPIVAFTPWVAYNLHRFDQPVYVSTGAGQTLAVGNCDLTYKGEFLGFYDVQCLFPPNIHPPTSKDPSVNDPKYRSIAMTYISHHKKDLPLVLTARVGRMWGVFRG